MKIKGLYETHLFVKNLGVSVDFYQNILGLTLCHRDENRKIAFFWVGKPKEAMLGLWEMPKEKIEKRHFAFRCEKEDILKKAVPFLEAHQLKPYNFLNDGTHRPMVFAWMPALALYFTDPDGHELEFIAILEGEGRADWGIISYEEWLEKQKS